MNSTTISFPLEASAVCILLNGEVDCLTLIGKRWSGYKYIIVCDGAWKKLTQSFDCKFYENEEKLIILGDGDSLANEDKPENFLLDDDQHNTDFEKALNWLLANSLLKSSSIEKVINVDVYWANGGELDHSFGNLAMACKFTNRLTCHFYTNKQYFRYVNQDLIINNAKDRTCSLFPFPHCTVNNTAGLLYPMTNYPMQIYTQQSLRNHINKDVAIIKMATSLSNNDHKGYVLFVALMTS